MVDLGLISGFFDFSYVFIEYGFGASPLQTSVASIPAGFFIVVLFEHHFSGKTLVFMSPMPPTPEMGFF